MKLSIFQFVFLIFLFLIFFSKNSSITKKLTTFIDSFIRYLKKHNSIGK